MSDHSIWPEHHQTEHLLREIQAGNEQAVDELLNRHREPLRQMIHFRLDRGISSRVDASDVIQDVLLEANRRLRNYIAQPQMPFHLWLRQLAQDQMIDLHRRHHAQRRSVDRERSLNARFGDQSSLDLAAQLADKELTPAASMIRKELEERFLQALDQLEETDREVIVMRHIEQMGNGEIARVLNLSEPAAGMRYLRALRRLRGILAGTADSHPEGD